MFKQLNIHHNIAYFHFNFNLYFIDIYCGFKFKILKILILKLNFSL